MIEVWRWLVQEGIYRDVLAAVVGALVTTALGWIPFKKARQRSAVIQDALDTSTPGGLTDVIQAMNQINAAESSGVYSDPGDMSSS